MIRPNIQRGLCFEQLDTRRLLAGDVTVVLTEFGYEITGDNQANSICVEKIADRQFLVRGENNTTLNGESVDLVINGSLGHISLGGGDDSFSYDYRFIRSFEQPISLDTGNGDDQVYLRVGTAANVDTGNGNDTLNLEIEDAQGYGSDFRLDTGRGDDQVRVTIANNSQASTNISSFYLDAGNGDDIVEFHGWVLPDYYAVVTLGAGDDLLIGDADASVPYRKLAVSGGSGHDTVVSADYFGYFYLFEFEKFVDSEENET